MLQLTDVGSGVSKNIRRLSLGQSHLLTRDWSPPFHKTLKIRNEIFPKKKKKAPRLLTDGNRRFFLFSFMIKLWSWQTSLEEGSEEVAVWELQRATRLCTGWRSKNVNHPYTKLHLLEVQQKVGKEWQMSVARPSDLWSCSSPQEERALVMIGHRNKPACLGPYWQRLASHAKLWVWAVFLFLLPGLDFAPKHEW